MTIGYKFLTRKQTSKYDGSGWEIGKWRKASGEGDLCGDGWLHYYRDPLLAELHNPVHGNYTKDAVLWKVEVAGRKKHGGLVTSGASRMRIIKRVKTPKISLTQYVAYGILAAKKVCRSKIWNLWADRWLDGADRSEESARAAARVAPWALWATEAAEAAALVANGARSATQAASAAQSAFLRALQFGKVFDLREIAREAMKY